MKSELCKTCEHTEVCMLDKNLVGDFYIAPNPMFFTPEQREASYQRFKEHEGQGFPCNHYLNIVRCKDCVYYTQYKMYALDKIVNVCSLTDYTEMEPDGFCSYGEKRTEEVNDDQLLWLLST